MGLLSGPSLGRRGGPSGLPSPSFRVPVSSWAWRGLALGGAAALSLAGAFLYAALPPGSPPRPLSQASHSSSSGVSRGPLPAVVLLHVAWVLCRVSGGASGALEAKAEAALGSFARWASEGPRRGGGGGGGGEGGEERRLVLHLLTDRGSRAQAQRLLRDAAPRMPPHQVVFHDVELLTEKLLPIVEPMQKLFSAGAGAYYSDAIFFLSIAMHRLMPKEISRIIQMDLDVEYRANIWELFEEFDRFPEGAVIGIAREMQPVYRHLFWQYRKEHPGTPVGDPPPGGLPGFNSGVLLLDLEAMRHSALYNSLLEEEAVRQLADKYHFRGHLGDQDFFTLVGMEHPELFHVLDCTWNRQLCTWWRDHGYAEVFEHYFRCDGHIKIYHGNCNTPIPKE